MTKKKTKPSKKKRGTEQEPEAQQELDETKDNHVIFLTATPHVLKEDTINLWSAPRIKERDYIGPPSPDYSHLNFEKESIEPVPISYPNLDMLQVPRIRKIGIKSCMELLGRFFNCHLYQTNPLQFWFLDILTDCLWRLQDDFQLPDDEQKKVLEYFLHFFKIIIDTKLNYSRKHFLKTFKETILLIGDLIEEGCLIIPPPNQLFSIIECFDSECDSERSFTTSTSTISNSGNEEIEAHVGIKLENVVNIFKLKNRISADNIFADISKSSSFDAKKLPSDDDSIVTQAAIVEKATEATINPDSNAVIAKAASISYDSQDQKIDSREAYNISDFYQADLSTPPRFLSSELAFARYRAKEMEYLADGAEEYEFDHGMDEGSPSSSVWTVSCMEHNADQDADTFDKSQLSDISKNLSETDICKITVPLSTKNNSNDIKSDPFHKCNDGPFRAKHNVFPESKPSIRDSISVQCKQSLSSISDTASSNTINRLIRARKKLNLDKQLKSWRDYNVVEQRIENMMDPNIGWQFNEDNLDRVNSQFTSQSSVHTNAPVWRQLMENDNNEASKKADERKRINIVITSAITDCVFEYLYDNFHFMLIKLAFQSTPYLINQNVNFIWKLPKIPKADFYRPARTKVKSPKIKKEKKSKSKSTKGSKKSAKKSKSSKKSRNKSKSSKKSSKKSKKGKKSSSKSSKGAKLSKAEKDRLKREKVQLEEERRKIEEDKKFMFPLADAATDELFENIFENWIKPKASKKKKKKRK